MTGNEAAKPGRAVLVVGAGNFGTCLAQHLAKNGTKVYLWSRRPEVAEHINRLRANPRYLTSFRLHDNIEGVSDLAPLDVAALDGVILAIPTPFLRDTLTFISAHIPKDALIISSTKGIEIATRQFPMDIIKETLPQVDPQTVVVLSGPSFAVEIMQSQPTAVALGSHSEPHGKRTQELFHTSNFRAYTSSDPMGLEVAGAFKNIIAIAAGACSALGFQNNSAAALITRGLAEITRIGVRLGSNPLTFSGLGGVGDLFLTCTSPKSRNYTVGYKMGEGKSLRQALKEMNSVAEGVKSAKAAYFLGQSLGVDLPITNAVYAGLYKEKPIEAIVTGLLNRDAKDEVILHPA